jgi:hypothetical protein
VFPWQIALLLAISLSVPKSLLPKKLPAFRITPESYSHFLGQQLPILYDKNLQVLHRFEQ